MTDLEIQELISKYPPIKPQDTTDHKDREARCRSIMNQANFSLNQEGISQTLKLYNAKLIAENFRSDMSVLTSDLLRKIDDADSKALKSLYNYNLNVERENQETREDVRQEYLYKKANPSPFTDYMNREMDK